MTTTIAPGVILATRDDWGADRSLPRRGHAVSSTIWQHTTLHHTVRVDNDATPNAWTSQSEVFRKMRQLQTIRPDLGLDVPYNFVIFLMEDGTIIICEGRGLYYTGAHTIGHNHDSPGIAIEGNFEDIRTNISRWVPKVNYFLGWLKYDGGCRNITARPHSIPTGQEVYFHEMFSATACPGDGVIDQIFAFRYIRYVAPVEEDEVTPEEFEKYKKQLELRSEVMNWFLQAAGYAGQGEPLPEWLKKKIHYVTR